ncbi:hypothetical protein CJD36_013100 [Flavipsychrobacter stenotrophus]|uniref:DUF5615 domain-containing protein n=1 Tax=Flavipsychrobacter stenotrophus TaxID=2077091 RepID=A0A2S7SVD5_9BACT|nr:DUF5615 family PIN-like protein [Flavipsychrobacter stenotrophus]PQJ10902.1 hypothetical protein CJD36_013100 [Flavipsychrobacter stenotrophus]
MQIWIDAQLSPSLALWINQNFQSISAFALRDLGLRDAVDFEIFKQAKIQKATIMTKDVDFLQLLEHHGPPPQIIWVTVGNTSNAKMSEILSKHLQTAIDLLLKGESVVEIGDI